MSQRLEIADLFCGAGGTSTGAVEAAQALGFRPSLTAVNHWPRAVETHSVNHPEARHLCASIDSLNPRELFRPGKLDLLWASPECTHHSRARGGTPMSDQSRASAFCVTRWAEALRPPTVLIENVPEFAEWGPLGSDGKPLKSRKGETFRAWIAMMEAIGYRAEARILCAADYGDPTTRRRLFVQFQLGRRKIVWPEATHSDRPDLFGADPWVGADRGVIDWSVPMKSIFTRKRPLAEKTLRRIAEGLKQHGGATIVAMEHGGRALNPRHPLPTVTCAKGGAFGLAYILGQHGGATLRLASDPCPTVTTAGAIRLIVEYYGNGRTHPVTRPLPTVTCNDRFALIKAQGGDVLFRMLRWHELAAAQGFRRDYKFTGTTTEITKQIGNAVPRRLARAIVLAAISQRPDIRPLLNSISHHEA
jgi:DNA (cytosine-5)-methyltransferase 1